MNNSPYNTI